MVCVCVYVCVYDVCVMCVYVRVCACVCVGGMCMYVRMCVCMYVYDLLRLYPPVLRVRGLRRTASHVYQEAMQNLVNQGTITPEQALEAVESAESY